MVDLDANRLAVARSLGATQLVDGTDGKAVDKVMELTAGPAWT
jgi:alcohol dehydrogenase